jgi:hypothetical protein
MIQKNDYDELNDDKVDGHYFWTDSFLPPSSEKSFDPLDNPPGKLAGNVVLNS